MAPGVRRGSEAPSDQQVCCYRVPLAQRITGTLRSSLPGTALAGAKATLVMGNPAFQAVTANVSSSGAFSFIAPPGRYRVYAAGLPVNSYLKNVLVDGRAAADSIDRDGRDSEVEFPTIEAPDISD